jgi:general secretion pathway protein K
VRRCRYPDGRYGAGSRGIALIAVLWFVVLLSLVATAFLSVTRNGIREAEGVLDRARAEQLADSGIELGIMLLLEPAHHPGLRTDGGVRMVDDGGRVAVSIQDVGGCIDLNEAEEPLLRALFLSAGLPEERAAALADAVVDWRDADGERLAAGAEAADYQRAGLPHGPANRPFYAVSELRQVIGVDRAIYAAVAPSLTVFSGSPDVDASVAPPLVRTALQAAGIDIEPEEPAAPATPVARAGASRRSWGRDRPALPASETDTYAIRAEAVLAGGARFVREAVVILTGDRRQPYTVQAWGTPGG